MRREARVQRKKFLPARTIPQIASSHSPQRVTGAHLKLLELSTREPGSRGLPVERAKWETASSDVVKTVTCETALRTGAVAQEGATGTGRAALEGARNGATGRFGSANVLEGSSIRNGAGAFFAAAASASRAAFSLRYRRATSPSDSGGGFVASTAGGFFAAGVGAGNSLRRASANFLSSGVRMRARFKSSSV